MKNIQRKNKIKIIIFSCMLLIVICSISAGAMAKYITSMKSEQIRVGTLNFSFVSSYPENTQSNPYYIVNDKISFELANTDGLTYTSVVTKFTVALDGVQKTSGTIEGSANTKKTAQVVLNSVSEGLHTVTITSKTPYVKTITLYFYVYTSYNNSFYKVIHHDNWVELNVYVGEDDNDITVNYTGVVPDATNAALDGFGGGCGTLTGLRAGSNYTYIFFGEVPEGTNPFELAQNSVTLIKGE